MVYDKKLLDRRKQYNIKCCELMTEILTKFPYLRFCQVLGNTVFNGKDPFYDEPEKTYDELQKKYQELLETDTI